MIRRPVLFAVEHVNVLLFVLPGRPLGMPVVCRAFLHVRTIRRGARQLKRRYIITCFCRYVSTSVHSSSYCKSVRDGGGKRQEAGYLLLALWGDRGS